MQTNILVNGRKITIKHPDGSMLVAGADGQVILKSSTEPSLVSLLTELDHELKQEGIGEWIKLIARPFAKLLGRTDCTGCEASRIAANAYGRLKAKYGSIKALKIIKTVWQDPSVDSVKMLQEHLQ